MPEEVDLEQIRELVRLVEKHHLAELTVEEDGVTITVKGCSAEAGQAAAPPEQQAVTGEAAPAQPAATPQAAPDDSDNIVRIESPMIGVFYRSSAPDAPPFVEAGDTIEVGQTIGLIEAMKVFSEIPSEVAGVVVDVPASNGKLVQQGEPLVLVRVA